MKHDMKITLYLVMLFITAQIVGLFLLSQTISEIKTTETGEIVVNYSEPLTGRPDLEENESFSYIVVMILIGTALLLLLIKFKLFKVWKAWFFLAIWGSLSIALSVLMKDEIAIILSLVLTYFKIYKPNAIIHNLTEIFVYAGLAILLSPLFTVFWAIMLLVAISIYDAIAVWKSKHMITLAKAQSANKMFAGLLIPYKKEKKENKTKIELKLPRHIEVKEEQVSSAILGGGDIAFPLMFAGSVMTYLIESGLSQSMAFFKSLIIPLFSGLVLYLLFVKSQKGKFYPAMPFISLGCFIGYGIILLL